jgi:hypothetical protein
MAVLGKVFIYFIYELIKKVGNYIKGNEGYRKAVISILESISNNKQVITDIVKLLNDTDGISDSTADKILKMEFVQNQITKLIDNSKEDLDEVKLRTHLKAALINAWKDKGMTDKVVDKIKKDIQ